jgi:hypothetical protein
MLNNGNRPDHVLNNSYPVVDPFVANQNNFQAPDPRFNENILPYIHPGEAERIGQRLTKSIAADESDRNKWLRILTQGITQLGLGGDRSPSTDSGKDTDLYAATFLTECLKITCKLFSTLFPSKDFAETKIYGFVNQMIEDQAYRTGEFFNFYTNEVMSEYIPDSEQAIWWSVLGGSSFVKPYYDPHKGRIVAPYIMPQDIIISSGASSIYDAERVTHRFTLTERQVEANFEKGIWVKKRQIEENTQTTDPVTRKVEQVMGLEDTPQDENKKYVWDECYTFEKINGFEEIDRDGRPTPRYLPYRVIKDKNSDAVVGIWRNYEERDVLFRPISQIIQHKYFTGFNAYGLGMIHIALGLAKTETKIQQQILKGAVLSNMPNLVQKSGLRTENNQLNFTPGVIPQINTFNEPLQNVFMPMPFNPPSPVIMQLKDACSRDIQNLSIARELKADQIPANTSATTVLGILSTSSDMPNSLVKSYYRSYQKEFQRIFDLLGQILPDEPYPFYTPGGNHAIMKSDFSSNIKIFPVMDPSNSSQSMQLMVNDILMQVSAAQPDLYNQRALQKRFLKTLKIQDVDTILTPDPADQPPPPPPPKIDAVSENTRVLQGVPIKAYKDQDHPNHNIVHKDQIHTLALEQEQDPTKDNSALIATLTAHTVEHDIFEYEQEIEAQTGMVIPEDPTTMPPEMQNELTLRAAHAAQQRKEQEQQSMPQPMDPSIPLMEENRVKEKGIELEAQFKQDQIRTDQLRIEKESRREEIEMQIKLRQLEMEENTAALEERRLAFQEIENERKHEIELKRIEVDVLKNNLQIQEKSFANTLKYENDRTKTELEVQSESFATAMAHDSNNELKDTPKEKDDGSVSRKK